VDPASEDVKNALCLWCLILFFLRSLALSGAVLVLFFGMWWPLLAGTD